MSLTQEQIIDGISELKLPEVVSLIEAMEEKFGVSAASVAPVAVSGAAGGEAVAEKSDFEVVVSSYGEKKINVIKVVRAVADLGLKEAKEKVDSVPFTLKEGVSKEEAEEIKKQLEEAGATVELK